MAHGSRNATGQTAANPNHAHASNGVLSANNAAGSAKVNQKKAKRRAKEAAKRQAQAQATASNAHVQQNPPPSHASRVSNQSVAPLQPDDALEYDDGYDAPEGYDGEEYYSEADEVYQDQYDPAYPTGSHPAVNGAGKKNKKKKKKQDPYAVTSSHDYHASSRGPPPPIAPVSSARGAHHRNGDHIWNTSTQQERERIKEFWLGLAEDDRRSLVKVEKEAVLKKMKEQQKHSCSCTVCGRKRTAIEEELEVLYDAYYEELEQYAEKGVPWASLLGIPAPLQPMASYQRQSRLPPDRMPALTYAPPQQQIMEMGASDDEGTYDEEESYASDDYDEDDDDYISDDEPEELPRASADFFQFGNSLTVKGGILTVADDLLKNDGKKFIEMMEQLAERRMQREEEAQYAAATQHPPADYYNRGHGHGAPEEDDYDDEDDEEYDSQDDDDFDDDEMETMTEEQRMQEGRRMFQIFAARMFEQRVLTAYREKVANERQQKLLEELAAEEDVSAQQAAKKAKDAEKRKAKKQAQKQKQQEEKARKDAELAEKEAAAKAEQDRKLEEQRKRREEQRLKKDEQRKAQEAEAARKAQEKQKRQKEEQDRRQEAERKAREQKEQERKAREEAKKKEREEREAREREAKERKAKADQERKERDAKEKETERLRKETQHVQAAQAVQAAKRAAAPPAVPIPPGLTKQPLNFASPHVQPAVPKAPTPGRPRQGSQQGSKGSSPKTPAALAGQPKAGSPGVIGGPPGTSGQSQNPPIAPKTILSRPPSQPPTSTPINRMQDVNMPGLQMPLPPGMHPPPGMPPQNGGGFGMPPPGLNGLGFQHGPAPMMPGNMQRNPIPQNMFSPPPQQPIGGGQFSRFGPPPGMGAPGMPPFGRGMQDGPPGFGGQLPSQSFPGGYVDTMPSRTVPGQHSRHHSGSSSNVDQQPTQPAPIGAPGQARPRGPGQRPSSTKPGEQGSSRLDEADELAKHLGSSALLDDTADSDFIERRPSMPPGLQHSGTDPSPIGGATPFGGNRGNSFPFGMGGNTWGMGTPQMPYGTPSLGGQQWGNSLPSVGGWPQASSGFGLGVSNTSMPTTSRPRVAQIRISMIDAFKAHASDGQLNERGFADAKSVIAQIQHVVGPQVQAKDMVDLLDTEGDAQNGGGSFEKEDSGSGELDFGLKWTPDDNRGGRAGNIGGAGDIGSPVVAPSSANRTPYGSMRGFSGLRQPGTLHGLGQGL